MKWWRGVGRERGRLGWDCNSWHAAWGSCPCFLCAASPVCTAHFFFNFTGGAAVVCCALLAAVPLQPDCSSGPQHAEWGNSCRAGGNSQANGPRWAPTRVVDEPCFPSVRAAIADFVHCLKAGRLMCRCTACGYTVTHAQGRMKIAPGGGGRGVLEKGLSSLAPWLWLFFAGV